ncbi:MAG: ATP-binding protein [Opitutaceae bacterium]|nr:ATP-binding protein [Opitutaceae bacterium]
MHEPKSREGKESGVILEKPKMEFSFSRIMAFLSRDEAVGLIKRAFAVHPAVTLAGPRQCGKTTLARQFAGQTSESSVVTFFDLERASDRQKLSAPEQALEPLRGLVVIDEIQRQPGLFETLRVLLDRPDVPARFLLTGSASPDLVRGVSESLAGRSATVDLGGFSLTEVGPENWAALWQRGGFPRSFLAADEAGSFLWRDEFVRSFLERDIPQFGIHVPAETLRRFWMMIAHYHGQVWNGAEFARALGTSEPTARRYLDILAGAYMVRVLPPWFENISKRQVKSPKIYVRDSGLLHSLFGLRDRDALLGHPKLGASWEGFALEQILGGLRTRDAWFWATQGGAELDLLVMVNGRRYGFEFKHADAPGTTKSMQVALADLGLEHLWVVYPGKERYALGESIAAVPVVEIPLLTEELVRM